MVDFFQWPGSGTAGWNTGKAATFAIRGASVKIDSAVNVGRPIEKGDGDNADAMRFCMDAGGNHMQVRTGSRIIRSDRNPREAGQIIASEKPDKPVFAARGNRAAAFLLDAMLLLVIGSFASGLPFSSRTAFALMGTGEIGRFSPSADP